MAERTPVEFAEANIAFDPATWPPHETARRASLGPDNIRELLIELSRRLRARGAAADIYLVGGAAIAMEFDSRRSTTDIDVEQAGADGAGARHGNGCQTWLGSPVAE